MLTPNVVAEILNRITRVKKGVRRGIYHAPEVKALRRRARTRSLGTLKSWSHLARAPRAASGALYDGAGGQKESEMKKLLLFAAVYTLGLTAAAAANHRNPRVDFSITPSPAQTGQAVTFDASATRCYGTGGWRASNWTSHVWQDDADPNKPLDNPFALGTGRVMTRSFIMAGTKYVWLTVRDAAGRQSQTAKDLVVNAALPPPAQCNDSRDNDGDGLSDFPADPGCMSPTDDTEAPNPATDTDGDGIPDGVDQCPTQPGPASNNGCAVASPRPGTFATPSCRAGAVNVTSAAAVAPRFRPGTTSASLRTSAT